MKRSIAPVVMATWLAAGSSALAQTPPEPSPTSPAREAPNLVEPSSADVEMATAPRSPWRIELSAWAWLMGVEGDLGVRGRSVSVDASFGDIVDGSDSIFALSGRLELGYGRIAGFIDALYADLGADDQTGPAGVADIDLDFKQTIVDFGLMYRVGDWEPSGDAAKNPRNLSLDLYGGGRYTALDVEIRPAFTPPQSQSEEWIDPIVGAKLVVPIAEHWHFAINGDIGGFGVESDFTWSTTALIGYDFHLFDRPASVLLGYRAMGWDFSKGSGTDEFEWQIVQHGLLLGFTFEF